MLFFYLGAFTFTLFNTYKPIRIRTTATNRWANWFWSRAYRSNTRRFAYLSFDFVSLNLWLVYIEFIVRARDLYIVFARTKVGRHVDSVLTFYYFVTTTSTRICACDAFDFERDINSRIILIDSKSDTQTVRTRLLMRTDVIRLVLSSLLLIASNSNFLCPLSVFIVILDQQSFLTVFVEFSLILLIFHMERIFPIGIIEFCGIFSSVFFTHFLIIFAAFAMIYE